MDGFHVAPNSLWMSKGAKVVQLHAKLCEARGESKEFVASGDWR